MWTSESLRDLLRVGALSGVALALGLLAHALWSVPSFPRATLGERGRQRARWLASGGAHVPLDVALRRVAGWVARLISRDRVARLERLSMLAGYPAGLAGEELVAASALAGVGGGVLAALWTWGVGASVWTWALPLAMFWMPALQVSQTRQKRVLALERSLPIAMDLVALCVRAGGDFPAALRFVVCEISDAHAACRHELSQVEEALAVGRTREQALQALGDRVDSPAVRDFVRALVQSERRGVPLSDALATQSETLRRVRSVRAEEMAAKASVRMILPLMLMLCAVLTVLLGPLVIEGVGM